MFHLLSTMWKWAEVRGDEWKIVEFNTFYIFSFPNKCILKFSHNFEIFVKQKSLKFHDKKDIQANGKTKYTHTHTQILITCPYHVLLAFSGC